MRVSAVQTALSRNGVREKRGVEYSQIGLLGIVVVACRRAGVFGLPWIVCSAFVFLAAPSFENWAGNETCAF